MVNKIYIIVCLFLLVSYSGRSQSKHLSLDVGLEQNYILRDWSANKRYSNPLTDKSTDLSFRLNWDATKTIGLWGQLVMVFGNGSKVEPAENYLDMFKRDHNLELDNYYIKNMKFHSRINYVPTLRIAVGTYFKINYKRCKFMPYLGAGFQSISSVNLDYDLKEKGSNNFYEVDYSWGGKSPNTYLGFVSAEMKFAYTFYPKRDLIIGLIYRRFVTKPKFTSTIKDYYREKKDDYIQESIQKGNLVNSFGISIGMNFR